MPNGASQAMEKLVLEWLLKQTTMGTAPSTLFFALHSADPGDTGANELTSTGAYARAQLNPDTNNSTNTNYNAIDQTAAASKITNKLDITFPQATADWNGGSKINFFSIWSASSAGTCYWSGTIAGGSGVTVNNGTTLKFVGGATGQLSITLD